MFYGRALTATVNSSANNDIIYSVPQTGSPRLGYNALSLTNGMSEYTYGPGPASFSTSASPGRPYTPTGSIYPGALSNLSIGELSQLGQCRVWPQPPR